AASTRGRAGYVLNWDRCLARVFGRGEFRTHRGGRGGTQRGMGAAFPRRASATSAVKRGVKAVASRRIHGRAARATGIRVTRRRARPRTSVSRGVVEAPRIRRK